MVRPTMEEVSATRLGVYSSRSMRAIAQNPYRAKSRRARHDKKPTDWITRLVLDCGTSRPITAIIVQVQRRFASITSSNAVSG